MLVYYLSPSENDKIETKKTYVDSVIFFKNNKVQYYIIIVVFPLNTK